MSTATLNAQARFGTGKGAARRLRSAQQIPAILYGHHRQPQPLAVDARELDRLLGHISPGTTVVELAIDGGTARTLIREIQRHPFKPQILHVDFQELVAGESITVDVPLVLVGTPEGVRSEGGVLDQVMRQVTVTVDPSSIPNHIDVDVSALGLNDSIHVRDLNVPSGVEVEDDPDSTVCVVTPPRVVEEAAPAAEGEAAEGAEPELIRKPKEEEGEEES
ncbi:MAG TPA: 50S ribosomal protein L25 [Gemmatimonadaceae bacterium]|nr:50S ribosomal protein L25 [Gemmatimonadaceae bacterium]